MHGSFTHAGGGLSHVDIDICDVNNIGKFYCKVDIQDGTHPEGHKQCDLMVNIQARPAFNSKFSHISVIAYYSYLDNNLSINGGLIQSNPSVNSNTCFNGFYDTNVSNACIPIDNMNVLTYCTSFHDELIHKHCCAYSQVFYTR